MAITAQEWATVVLSVLGPSPKLPIFVECGDVIKSYSLSQSLLWMLCIDMMTNDEMVLTTF